MHSKACAVGGTQQAATDDTIGWPSGVMDYAGGKKDQRMLSSLLLYFSICLCMYFVVPLGGSL